MLRLAGVAVVLAICAACSAKIDRFTVDKLVDEATDVPDTGKVCATGAGLTLPLASVAKNRPELALTISEGVAALCDEQVAWEEELRLERARVNEAALGAGRAAEITDATVAAARAHTRAAARFERSFRAMEAAFGPIGVEGGSCPKIADRDEFVYVFGLVTGTLALLHDRSGGGANDVPMDRLAVIARASACLDDAAWWSLPSALRGSAWASIPGSGPAGTDPWKVLADAADLGDASGVRVARALQVLMAANAGRDDVLAEGLAAHAATLASRPADPEWALLDTYATEVSLHQSDLWWTRARGHRTERFGQPPTAPAAPAAPAGSDPFGADPFGAPEPVPVPAPVP